MTSKEGKVYAFEKVKSFFYLGTVCAIKPDKKEEIQNRLMAGNRCIYDLQNKEVHNSDETYSDF